MKYDPKIMIQANYCFYSGTLYAKPDGVLKDDYDRPIFFDSEEDAVAFLTEIMDLECCSEEKKMYARPGTYVLSHGQYDRPDYTIVTRRRKYWDRCSNFSNNETLRRNWVQS